MYTAMYKFVTFSYRSSIILVLFSSKLSPFLFDCQNTIETNIYSLFRTNCMIQIYLKHAHSHRHQNRRVGSAEWEHSPFTTPKVKCSHHDELRTNHDISPKEFLFLFFQRSHILCWLFSCTKVLWMTLQVQLVHLQLYKSSGETIYLLVISV